MIVAMAGDFQADREVEKLINHFGGADQWREVSRQLLAYGQKNLPGDVLNNLSSSY
jgi:sulfur transfer protein SufE